MLTWIAILYLPNPLRPRPSTVKSLDPLPLPPNLHRQTLSSRHNDNHGLDRVTNDCICASCLLPVYTCRFVLGCQNFWKVYQFSGVRVRSSGSQHFRGLFYNVPTSMGAEGSEIGFEEEDYSWIHVRFGIFVSFSLQSKPLSGQTC
jgi:hypothetical protein